MSRANPRAVRRPDPVVLALARRRVALALTQDAVAQRIGYAARQCIADLESGRRNPTLATLHRWAAALDCEIAVKEAGRG